MRYKENSATAAKYLKQAIPLMVDKKIPTNPINYTLWYNYVANHIPLLNRALENVVKDDGNISPEKSYELFFNYVLQDDLEEQNQSLESITKVANHILQRLGASLKDSQTFDQQIGDQMGNLEHASSIDDITEAIDQMLSAAQGIRDSNNDFKQGLEQANNEINTLKDRLQEAEKQVYIDQLTQIHNRHAFDRKLSELLNNEDSAVNTFLIMLDLDHFKFFNDNYGHVLGDQVLQSLGKVLHGICTDNVFGARYGGEEFALLIENGTPEQAGQVAELARKQVEGITVKASNSEETINNISASFGVARHIRNEPAEAFIDRADSALYQAKKNGRNRIEIYKG